MKVRLAFPVRGWAQLSWHHEEQPSSQLVALLEDLKKAPGVRWNHAVVEVPKTAWMLPAWLDVLGELELHAEFLGMHPRGSRWARGEPWPHKTPWRQGWTPYAWQLEAVRHGLDAGHLLLCDDMGLGKTRSAIELDAWFRYYYLNHGLGSHEEPTLIVAPGFTVDVWRRELLATGAIESEEQFCVLRSRDHDSASWRPGCPFYFVHYDVVGAWASHIALAKPLVVIYDEIHWCKNGKTQRAKGALMAGGRARMRIGLTGTPLANRVEELWAPLSILTGKNTWGSPIAFRQRYAGAVRTEFGWEDRKPTHVEELQQRLAPIYLRRTIDDIDHVMPPLQRQLITAPMDAANRAAHDDAVDPAQMHELVSAIVQGRAGEQTFAVLAKLRKATSAAKLSTTIELVYGLLEQGQSVVCFAWQKRTAQQIAVAVAARVGRSVAQRAQLSPVVGMIEYITGEHPQEQRDGRVRAFQAAVLPSLLVATYGVLKEGVTLTKARAVVLHDLDWVPSNILQAEKRVHRLGQSQPCMSYWMVAEDSIDTILARLLMLKAEVIQQVLGIDAPAQAADELGLSDLWTKSHEPEQWAREQMARWFA